MNSSTRWKAATLVAVLVAALAWAVPPATSHVAGWKHNWKAHIMPLADKRYYTKKQSNQRYVEATLRPGERLSGVWILTGGSGGYGMAAIDFPARVAGAVTPFYVDAPTAACPGPGQAAPGTLCVYENWSFSMSFAGFLPTAPGGTVTPHGTTMYFSSTNIQGNARGTWTVGAPTTASPRVAPRTAPQDLPRSLG
jgi:hypothetical protein